MPRWQSDAECSIQKTYLTMEVYNFYCDNVALLYRHFGNFSNNARSAYYGDVDLTLELI